MQIDMGFRKGAKLRGLQTDVPQQCNICKTVVIRICYKTRLLCSHTAVSAFAAIRLPADTGA